MRHPLLLISTLFTLFAFASLTAAPFPGFPFHEDGTFRVCQVTDIQDVPPINEDMAAFLRKTLAEQRPDLALLTGDNTETCGDKQTFPLVAREIVDLFREAGVPFAITFGNHDSEKKGEQWFTRQEQYDIFRQLGGDLFVDHDVPELSGVGSGAIALKDQDKPAFLLLLMDSGDYARGGYDGCRKDQIRWYEENASHLPCLWFQHIIPWDIYENGVLEAVPPTQKANPSLYNHIPATPEEEGAFFSAPLNAYIKPLPQGVVWLPELHAYGTPVPKMHWVPSLGAYMLPPPGSHWCPMTGQFMALSSRLPVEGTMEEAPCPPTKECYEDQDHTWQGRTLYQSWRKMGNLKGAYFGHDHVNTFDAIDENGIRMGFGKAATLHSYNDGNPGVRFFDIRKDGTYKTWTVTLH